MRLSKLLGWNDMMRGCKRIRIGPTIVDKMSRNRLISRGVHHVMIDVRTIHARSFLCYCVGASTELAD